ncbi:hypothetical protein FNV43_RR02061 [Rhamnella rubrinervis]|uniref:Transferase, Chloramphenicol acetyltransferase-like domain protein n=1 Tax=Rhamnella rubrinervis TaxID=2594499 RepID=A0A8K0HS48_9ROSA|nr:hypothetical protein FNV43_RR02061 [Rhamnella rubrinervis]
MANIIDLQVIFKGNIKPSAPTPDHRRQYHLSYLDQIKPSFFMPLILFYAKEPHSNLSRQQYCDQIIRKSLSEVLTHFYPLAGRIKSKLYVDCNDEGAYYVEAEARCQLLDILHNPNAHDMNRFLPLDLCDVKDLPLMVQVTFFDCGGMAVGVGLNHEIGDALSLVIFLNTWSKLSQGQTNFKTPIFGTAKLFPPKDVSCLPVNRFRNENSNNIVTKRFVFDAANIEALINKYSVDNVRPPTRFEALTAFISNRLVASKHKGPEGRTYSLWTPVNIRTRTEPKISENYFGNISASAISMPSLETNKNDGIYHNIISPMRDAVKQINNEFVKKLQQTDEYLNLITQQHTKRIKGEITLLMFTSLCRFPIYEINFGWGTPVFAAPTRMTYSDKIVFFDTKSGDGIEAWINLKGEDMAKFEADEDVLCMFPRCQLPSNVADVVP